MGDTEERFEAYRVRRLAEIRERYEGRGQQTMTHIKNYLRVASLIRREIDSFLQASGLVLDDEGPELGPEEPLWSAGAELISIVHRPQLQVRRMHRRRVAPVGGGALSQDQEMLLLEFQLLIFLLLDSLSRSADELVDVISGRPGVMTFARFAMFQSLCSQWGQDAFWDELLLPSVVFHERLLITLERLLVSIYENKTATTSVCILDRSLDERVRWSSFSQEGMDIFSQDRLGLRLSDGESTAFVFSGTGEFLGFHDMQDLLDRLDRPERGWCRWAIRRQSSLEFLRAEEPTLQFHNGRWRYVDQAATLAKLEEAEPSVRDVNRRVWEVARELSKRRYGGLILIVPNAQALTADGVCDPSELNLPGLNRFECHALRSGYRPEDFTHHTVTNPLSMLMDLNPKELLLEQFRGRRVEGLSVELLVGLTRVDGALIVARTGEVLGFGVILGLTRKPGMHHGGARTAAAIGASKYGVVVAISEDGPVSVYKDQLRL